MSQADTDRAAGTRLHVLQVFQPETGGVPRYAARLVTGLVASGWRVSVACPVSAWAREGLREAGVEVLPLDVRRSPNPLQDARASRRLARWCRERHVALIHGHSTKAGMLVAIAGRMAAIPSLYTPHCWAFERRVMPGLRAAYALHERALARYHAAVLTVSESERAAAERWGVAPRGRIQVVRTGLPAMPAFSSSVARQQLGVERDAVIAAWVGRAGAQKQPHGLAPIARALAGSVTVLVLCDGLHGTALASELRDAGAVLADPGCDPATVYAAADLMLHTSSWDASPLVVLEAMAASLPVVAYDVGGVSEQIYAGRTGYLVGRGDIEMMCECVRALAINPAARERMGEAARERGARMFSYASMLERITQTYLAVAGPTVRGAGVANGSAALDAGTRPGLLEIPA